MAPSPQARKLTATSQAARRPRCIYVSGQPGCGKTFLLRRAQERLAEQGLRCRGFITEEVLQRGGRRAGFDIVTIPDGKRQPLARKHPHKDWKHRTGEYVVDVNALDTVAVPTLEPAPRGSVDLYVVDEIGRMELHSEKFKQAIQRLLTLRRPLLATVAAPRYGHTVPFAEKIKKQPGVTHLHLKTSVRETVASELNVALSKLFPASQYKSTAVTRKRTAHVGAANAPSAKRTRSTHEKCPRDTPQEAGPSHARIAAAMLNLAQMRGASKSC